MFKRIVFIAALACLLVAAVSAAPGGEFSDPCYYTEKLTVMVVLENATIEEAGTIKEFTVQNTCDGNTSITWPDELNLTFLGNVTDGEIVVAKEWIFVDTVARPDLDAPATLVFRNVEFVLPPTVLRNGVVCGDCNVTSDIAARTVTVDVPGFSNYSLSYSQDFTVNSDYEPELKSKVYQTIDLGDARRNEEYACIVQIYGQNQVGQYILIQTNPKRQVQAKLLGNPDSNQPESLGYFPTKNGLANVYFTNDKLAGYYDLVYVAQCANNSTKLVYEESISTRYSPVDRTLVGRGVWLSDSSNAFYLTVWVVGGLISIWVLLGVWRSIKWRL